VLAVIRFSGANDEVMVRFSVVSSAGDDAIVDDALDDAANGGGVCCWIKVPPNVSLAVSGVALASTTSSTSSFFATSIGSCGSTTFSFEMQHQRQQNRPNPVAVPSLSSWQ